METDVKNLPTKLALAAALIALPGIAHAGTSTATGTASLTVINQCSVFPKGKHDDLVDTVSMAVRHIRETGLLVRGAEYTAQVEEQMQHRGAAPRPLYSV